ncbi:NAD-P-binding protein [Mycena crocata]|nr:NAD-P-binding protein [Mycena crocata]
MVFFSTIWAGHPFSFLQSSVPFMLITYVPGYHSDGREFSFTGFNHNHNEVYIAARSPQKAKEDIAELHSQTGKEAEFLELDSLTRKEKKLNVLFNNGYAVILLHQPSKLMAFYGCHNGELQLLLVRLFLVCLILEVRSFNSSSCLIFVDVMLSNELARRYGDSGIVSVALNRGNLRTGLHRNLIGFTKWAAYALHYPMEYGALTQLWAGTSSEGATFNGKYLIPWARMGKMPDTALTPGASEALWTWLEE